MKKQFKALPPKFRFFNTKIGTRLFVYMSFNVIFVILICCAFNIFALTKFYTYEKTNELISALYQIENIYSQDIADDTRDLMFEKISNDKNIHLIITDTNNEVAYSSLPEDAIRFGARMNAEAPPYKPELPSETNDNSNAYPELLKQNFDFHQFNRSMPKQRERHKEDSPQYKTILVSKTDKYEIYNNYNPQLNSFDIRLNSVLNNGYTAKLMLAMSPIKEGSGYLNRFLIFAGGIAILLSLIPMLFLTQSFTRPIRELSAIAKDMANLKFTKKYKGISCDEIGELGNSINSMSEKLEATIMKLRNDIVEKETIDKRRREFLSNVSHELKTPIALVEAYAEGLNENIAMSDDDRKYYCEVILDEANKMSTIIQKLMSLMRLENGDDTVELSTYNINDQIRRIISEQTILFTDDKTLNIEFEPSATPMVTADEFLIDEVLTNYISNAVKYKSENGNIKVYTEKTDNKLRINVFNTAPLFTDEEQLKIWDSFYMADKARTYVDGSRGLGLSIVSAIIKAHNEEYGVENAKDGVVFYFTLESADT